MNVFPPDLIPLSWGICNSRGVDCGYVIRADVLFISSLHEQRRNRTKEETRRLLAKKLKIEACFLNSPNALASLAWTRLVLHGKHLQFSSRFFAKGRKNINGKNHGKSLSPLSLGICNPRGGDCGYVIRAGRETRNYSSLWIRRSTRTSLEINFFCYWNQFLCSRGFAIPEVLIADMLSARVGRPAIIPPCGSGDPQGQGCSPSLLRWENLDSGYSFMKEESNKNNRG